MVVPTGSGWVGGIGMIYTFFVRSAYFLQRKQENEHHHRILTFSSESIQAVLRARGVAAHILEGKQVSDEHYHIYILTSVQKKDTSRLNFQVMMKNQSGCVPQQIHYIALCRVRTGHEKQVIL